MTRTNKKDPSTARKKVSCCGKAIHRRMSSATSKTQTMTTRAIVILISAAYAVSILEGTTTTAVHASIQGEPQQQTQQRTRQAQPVDSSFAAAMLGQTTAWLWEQQYQQQRQQQQPPHDHQLPRRTHDDDPYIALELEASPRHHLVDPSHYRRLFQRNRGSLGSNRGNGNLGSNIGNGINRGNASLIDRGGGGGGLLQNGTAGGGSSVDLVTGTILLPNATMTQSILGSTLTLTLTSIACINIRVDSINLTHAMISSTNMTANLLVSNLRLECNLNYDYDYLFLNSNGIASVISTGNQVSLDMLLLSTDFSQWPPNQLVVTACNPYIQIDSVSFSGGFLGLISDVVQAIEDSIRDTISTSTETLICNLTNSLEQFADEYLLQLNERVDPLLNGNAVPVEPDPLLLEQSVVPPSGGAALVDFENPQTQLSKAFVSAFKQITSSLGGANGQVGLNDKVQSNLQQNGALSFDLLNITAAQSFGNAIVNATAMLGVESVTMQSLEIFGLDQFSSLQLLQPLGSYTLDTSFQLDELHFRVFMEIVVGNRTNPDNSTYMIENIYMDVGLGSIDGSVAFLLVIDESVLAPVPLGTFLTLQDGLCLLQSVLAFNLASVWFRDITLSEPTLSGFENGLAGGVTEGVLSFVYDSFAGFLDTSLPLLLNNATSDLVGSSLLDLFPPSLPCNESATGIHSTNQTFVDFRDLLLPPDEARAYGGLGTAPYGTLVSRLASALRKDLVDVDPSSGQPGINALIGSATESQSGIAGTIVMTEPLVEVNHTMNLLMQLREYLGLPDAGIELNFKLDNLTVENLNSFQSPLSVLGPVIDEANTIHNEFTWGSKLTPLEASVHITMGIKFGGTETSNTVRLGGSINSIGHMLTMLIRVQEDYIFGLPLQDILNINCWLAAIPIRNVDERQEYLQITNSDMDLSGVYLSVDCVHCPNRRFKQMIDAMAGLEQRDMVSLIDNILSTFDRFRSSGMGLNVSSLPELFLSQLIVKAPEQCPYRVGDDPDKTGNNYTTSPTETPLTTTMEATTAPGTLSPLQMMDSLPSNSTGNNMDSSSPAHSIHGTPLWIVCCHVLGAILVLMSSYQ